MSATIRRPYVSPLFVKRDQLSAVTAKVVTSGEPT